MSTLFNDDLSVINVGIGSFAETIQRSGGQAVNVEWRPQQNTDIARALAELVNHEKVEAANEEAFGKYLAADPVLEDVGTAGEVIPEMGERTLLHSGPPVEWARMCGPQQGAVIGAILLEGWADSHDKAEQLAASDEITYAPCHHYNAVGPMAGIISPSMPVWMIREQNSGIRTFSNLNEGLGKVLRYGANSEEVIERLKWMADVMGPALGQAVRHKGKVELKPMMAQALHMGDEVHNRNVAATCLFARAILPALFHSGFDTNKAGDVADFIAATDVFFLNLSMAACKAMTEAAHGVENSTMVTAMARNGTDFGIRVSGTGDAWFTTPAFPADGLFFPGYSADDAAADMGDSAITETAGIGGFAMAASTAIVKFVGGTPAQALAWTREMYPITIGENPNFTIPVLDFAGTPAGIDVRKVIDTCIAPFINTGIAHKQAGVGQIGAGLTRAPMECFNDAVTALYRDIVGES